ncbi:hypothetical protein DDD63_01770 [Actinobaculum sp. 313]|nr:hypothetical protein DDD63_01770 [Actinobaculum sp. 313]
MTAKEQKVSELRVVSSSVEEAASVAGNARDEAVTVKLGDVLDAVGSAMPGGNAAGSASVVAGSVDATAGKLSEALGGYQDALNRALASYTATDQRTDVDFTAFDALVNE